MSERKHIRLLDKQVIQGDDGGKNPAVFILLQAESGDQRVLNAELRRSKIHDSSGSAQNLSIILCSYGIRSAVILHLTDIQNVISALDQQVYLGTARFSVFGSPAGEGCANTAP